MSFIIIKNNHLMILKLIIADIINYNIIGHNSHINVDNVSYNLQGNIFILHNHFL